ncbi:MAG: sensor histidine kinase [Clostridiales bacterium]|uniref:sensor histidine kinase n=1 Tax=Provencibacterium massiliense TaxID=1841868 RepID=UPI0009A6E31B|nr:HAMP domain-containing sensor histidine kinase [Provencibacterium massiliense]PWM39028.1 MAG: sensor histidine kinase [Clostridiales bacterium]RGB69756.1 sensor histidine kinase [Harryflintia acetispora]
MFKKLHLRLTLLCTLITAVILTSMAAGVLYIAQRQQEESDAVALRSDLNSILYHLQFQSVIDRSWLAQTENGNRLLIHIEDKGSPLRFEGSYPTSTDRAQLIALGKEAAAAKGFHWSEPPSSTIEADVVTFSLSGEAGEPYLGAAAATSTPMGWLNLIVLKDMRLPYLQGICRLELFAALVLMGTLLLALFSWWFTGRALRPVEESRVRQTRFIAAASHELRSPLAVIGTSASAIPKAAPEQAKRFAAAIGTECRRMSRLVDDLLLLAGRDAKTWSVSFQPLEVETLLLDTCELYESLAAERGISLRLLLEDEEPLPKIQGDRQRLGQVLSVLLDNALCYTPRGGRITLCVKVPHNALQILVSDTGNGIPDEHKAHIFERFYRVESSRSNKEHYGLGLSIAKEIVELHKGHIFVRDTPGGGATFVVELPSERH